MIVTISGSQMDRIVRCPASAALPHVYDANPDEHRDRGTAMHKFVERVIAIGREAALAEVDEAHRTFCESIELAKMADRLTLSSEVALAYNFVDDTARRLLPLEHRAYEIDPAVEIPLTVDLAGVGVGEVFIGDLKSGHAWLPEPHQSMQLGLGALALARLYEAHKATVEYIRVRDDGTIRRFGAELDVFALAGFAERVSVTMQTVAELRGWIFEKRHTPTVTEGQHCRYCPARQHCPAKTALIRQVMKDADAPPYTIAITPENAADVYATLHKAKSALAQIEGAVYAYAKSTPIPLGEDEDGSLRFFGEQEREGNDVLSGAVVHQVVAEIYGGEAANLAVTMEATKAGLTDTVRKYMPKDAKVTHEVKKALELVKERGGITNPRTCTTREFTVAPDGTVRVRKRKAG